MRLWELRAPWLEPPRGPKKKLLSFPIRTSYIILRFNRLIRLSNANRVKVKVSAAGLSPSRVQHSSASPNNTTLVDYGPSPNTRIPYPAAQF